MAWLGVFLLCALTFGGLWWSGGCSRPALELLGAVLMLALAGYAWQGSPNQPGFPVSSPSN
jgi:hypothetical protein